MIVLILGSGPNSVVARTFPDDAFQARVAINNAWRVRPDWTHLIFPEDFPAERRPPTCPKGQAFVTARDFVPAQNALGGFVYAGATMAYTAGYWALRALRPRVMAFLGCDMTYAPSGNTHFYGTGTADPLRDDITLQDLSAKSARLEILAARSGCHCVNLSTEDSRLTFPRSGIDALADLAARPITVPAETDADIRERQLGYMVTSGRYWEAIDTIDATELALLDGLWSAAHADWRPARPALLRSAG
jgi:hypothetical protein